MLPANQPRTILPAGPAPLELGSAQTTQSRATLVQRLSEIVAWPETRVPAYERQLAGDILVGLLRVSNVELRRRCALGLAAVNNAPKPLLRYLARDEIGVAQQLLEAGVGFDDSDLIATVRGGVLAHWLAIARRRGVSEPVTDVLVQTGETSVIETVLRNSSTRLSSQGVGMVVARSRQSPGLAPLLVARPELRPTQALVLFWWANFETRQQILRRFAVDRAVLIEGLSEIFKQAAIEGWTDPETRKTLQMIERRQRNRAAAELSPFGSLEGALAAAEKGVDGPLTHEIAHLAGVKPATVSQIFGDPGGEAIGVFCKAVGLKRPSMIGLWRALRRPLGDVDKADNPLGRALYVFDTLATARAQTVLRYWNWSFTADAIGAERLDESEANLSVARRNAALLLNRNS